MNKHIVFIFSAVILIPLLNGCMSEKAFRQQVEQTGDRELLQYTKIYQTLPLKSTPAVTAGIRNSTYRNKMAFRSDSGYLGFTNAVLQIGSGRGDQILKETEALIYGTSVTSDYTNIHYGITQQPVGVRFSVLRNR